MSLEKRLPPLDMNAIKASVRALPALPEVVFRLIRSLDDPHMDMAQLEELVGMDQGLVTRVMRIANSPFYGLLRQVGTVRDAAMVIGFGALRNLAISTATVNHFKAMQLPGDFDYHHFWVHGMSCALAADLLAQAQGEPAGVAFTAGLLHDIGRLVLASVFPAHYIGCRDYRVEHRCSVIEGEQAVVGLAHPFIGAALAEHWHFPVLVTDAIEFHHDPAQALTPMAHIVHLADGLVRQQVSLDGEGQLRLGPHLSADSWSRYGVPLSALETLKATIAQRLQAVDEALGHSLEHDS